MKYDWEIEEIREIHDSPLMPLILRASEVHGKNHPAGEVQCCQILNIKFGGCTEDCSYCAQAARYHTGVQAEPLLEVEEVRRQAEECKRQGVTRMCLSAAWREVRNGKAFDQILDMVRVVKSMGLEVCCTLGMLKEEHVERLKDAGVYAINHNIDTSEDYYSKIITTRKYSDRLQTIARVQAAGISVCCGGIIGMGETLEDRLSMLQTLSSMTPHPDSVPINLLSPVPGTPLGQRAKTTGWELLRMVATARILMPKSMVRLSSGRLDLSLAQQALCFVAGANSIHVGPRLLLTPNPRHDVDWEMFRTLGLTKRSAYQAENIATKKTEVVDVNTFMNEELEKRKTQGIHRTLAVTGELIDFTSNDYLGLARSDELLRNINTEFHSLVLEGGIRPYVGATGSRLLTGNSTYVEALEKHLAVIHGAEAGLLFNSGYTANLGLLSAVIGKDDTIILDTQVHASTWEGAKVSGARLLLFRHNNMTHLESQLKKAQGRIFVCVESLYSMGGDVAPLDALCDLCDRYGANVIVDEAHAIGVFGPKGRGVVNAHSLEKRVFARIHAFGKALGTHGAIVLGSKTLRDYLINFSRPLIYSTAFPLHTLVSIRCAYDMMLSADDKRQHLQKLIVALKTKGVATTDSPIQPITIHGAEHAKKMAARLAEVGYDVRPILSPTVRKGSECLRLCLHAFNTMEDLHGLCAALSHEAELSVTA